MGAAPAERPLAVRAGSLALPLAGCVLAAALSLLLPSVLTYDPWTWMGWGRDVASLSLDTRAGPAFKPLPVLAGTLLAPLGDLAPWVWLVAARAGALLAAVMAWRLARRLAAGSVLAGAVAFAGVLLCGGWLWNGWLGNAEGLMLGLVLLAAERALDGRLRWALGLGFAAALLRLEAAPFLALYGAWLWRRDPGARAWVAAALAALPVAWLGPDLLAAGDPFRSSERARIPNPGAPALAQRPALDSLGRALVLAPTAVWAGALLALVGVRRGALPRVAALPVAAGGAWVALVALMSEAGYSGEERYAMPGVALAAVAAGAGVAWAARAMPRRATVLVAAAIVALAVGEQAGGLADDARGVRHEVRLYGSVDDAVAAAGGRDAVLRCGPVHTAPYSRPALAWRLRVPLRRLSTEPASGGTVFRARPWEGAPIGRPIEPGRLSEVARAGEWTVLSSCRSGS